MTFKFSPHLTLSRLLTPSRVNPCLILREEKWDQNFINFQSAYVKSLAWSQYVVLGTWGITIRGPTTAAGWSGGEAPKRENFSLFGSENREIFNPKRSHHIHQLIRIRLCWIYHRFKFHPFVKRSKKLFWLWGMTVSLNWAFISHFAYIIT